MTDLIQPPTIKKKPHGVTNKERIWGVRIDEVEEIALRNYEKYYGIPKGSATILQVTSSSAGIKGWFEYDHSKSIALASVKPYCVSSVSSTKKMDRLWGVQSDDVYDAMRENENLHRSYDPRDDWIKYRRVLVDWMCDAGDEFELYLSTSHVSVMLLDRVLHKVTLPRNKLQLVAIVCILIAAKYEEREKKVPTLSELNRYAQWAYDPDQIRWMEVRVLKWLEHKLRTYTPLHFTEYYISKGVLLRPDYFQGHPVGRYKQLKRYLKRYVEFFADLCLQDYKFQQYTPSLMGASIIMASRCALHVMPIWRKELETLTKYTESEVEPCFKEIWACYCENFPTSGNKKDPDVYYAQLLYNNII